MLGKNQRLPVLGIAAGVTLSIVLPLCGSAVAAVFLGDVRWDQIPFHSLVESLGGLMAVAIAGILIAERSRKEGSEHYTWMAGALIGMGVLDLYHAAVWPGNLFVWLHSTATFVGGLLFAMVWVPRRHPPPRFALWIPWVVLAAAMAFGGCSWLMSSWIPAMVSEAGHFTVLARGLNIGGGLGFFLAGLFFVRRFHRHADPTDWLFATHTILFGVAGVLFELSALWDAAWWWWHVLRLFAYLAALGFAVRAYLDAEHEVRSLNRELRDINQNLDRTVAERTAKLRAGEDRFRRVIEAAPNAFLVVHSTGTIQLVNAETERLFGYQREELIGQMIETLVPPPLQAKHVTHRGNFFAQPTARAMGQGLDLSGRRKDGSEFTVEIGLTPINLDGETVVLCSVFDMTARKQAEETLVRAREAAESASRAKTDFLANMSHEIRTPMNAIIGMTGLVLDTQLDPTQKDYLTIVQDSAESLLSIINEVLDFSRIEAGKLELTSVSFNLREELGNALKSIGQRAHAKDIELACQVHANVPPFVAGDAVRLRQVWVNLVGNAIKFTEQGEIVVEVRYESGQDSPAMLHFTVRDTGIGIPPDKRDRIFAAFEQADSSTTRKFGGSGLGLAISSRVVEAMGGRIWLESEVGQGSTFHFAVPFQPGEQPATQKRDIPDLSGVPVVVVDDNTTNRKILQEMVACWNMPVRTVESVPQALAALQQVVGEQETTPLLLSDVNMPEMDGFMLVEKVRAHPILRETRIILLTSGGRPGDAARCAELGMSAQLMKPVKQSELLEAVMVAVGWQPRPLKTPESEKRRRSIPSLQILVAEDGKTNQKLAVALLEKWGHRVVVAGDGEEAISRCRKESFDLILMDVQMPVLDGLDATRRIRHDERQTGRHIPIVAMTARAMAGDRESCLAAGMDDYVAKPLREQELYQAIASLFAQREAAPSVTPTKAQIDWELALDTVAGDSRVLKEVTDAAERELPELLEGLERAYSERELCTIERIAHTIKGTSLILAAEAVVVASEDVEQAAHAGDGDWLARSLPSLQALVRQMIEELPASVERT